MTTFCDTQDSTEKALLTLSEQPYIFLDCEGRDLGTAEGALSIVSVGTAHGEGIYLFDFVVLPGDAIKRVLAFLSDNKVRKVVWDGRMDFVELFYAHDTPIDDNVLDLQLVDIVSRRVKGETDYQRIKRLVRANFPLSEVRKLQLDGVNVLNSLDGAVCFHCIYNVALKGETVKKMHAENGTQLWMARPLTDVLLEYAASDISRIAALYDHFEARGYFAQPRLSELLIQSTLYVGFFRQFGRPNNEDKFLKSGLLPLGILDSMVGAAGVSQVSVKTCDKCRRQLPTDFFPFKDVPPKRIVNGAVKGITQTSRCTSCRVCCAIDAKEQYRLHLEAVERLTSS